MRSHARFVAAVLALSAALVLSGCGWGIMSDVAPDYGATRSWRPLSAVPVSASPSEVAASIPALDAVEVVEVEGDASHSVSRDATSLVVVAVIPEVRVTIGGDGVARSAPLGSWIVVMSQGPNTFATAGIRKSADGWQWTPDAVAASWWAWTTASVPGGFDPAVAGISFAPTAEPLSWLILPRDGADEAFPMVHMGPVRVQPPGSTDFETLAIRPYPLEYAAGRIRH